MTREINYVDGITVVPADWLNAMQDFNMGLAWNVFTDFNTGNGQITVMHPQRIPAQFTPDVATSNDVPTAGITVGKRMCVIDNQITHTPDYAGMTSSGETAQVYFYFVNQDSNPRNSVSVVSRFVINDDYAPPVSPSDSYDNVRLFASCCYDHDANEVSLFATAFPVHMSDHGYMSF